MPRTVYLYNDFRDNIVKILQPELGPDELYYSAKAGYRIVVFHPQGKVPEDVETVLGGQSINEPYGVPENGILIDQVRLTRIHS